MPRIATTSIWRAQAAASVVKSEKSAVPKKAALPSMKMTGQPRGLSDYNARLFERAKSSY